jgi:hypothetical protein
VGYLSGFTWRGRAGVVAAALDAAGAEGEVVVVGSPRMARALGGLGRKATHVDALAAAADALAALVAVTREEPDPEWTREVRAGGAVVLVAALASTELSRRALCAGLVDLEERRAGRLLVMSGRVWKPRSSGTPR